MILIIINLYRTQYPLQSFLRDRYAQDISRFYICIWIPNTQRASHHFKYNRIWQDITDVVNILDPELKAPTSIGMTRYCLYLNSSWSCYPHDMYHCIRRNQLQANTFVPLREFHLPTLLMNDVPRDWLGWQTWTLSTNKKTPRQFMLSMHTYQ